MGELADLVCARLRETVGATHVECDEEDSCAENQAKLSVRVVSAQFLDDKTLLQRHRRVNQSLADLMPRIHALSIKAWTPEQYEARRSTTEQVLGVAT